MAPNQLANEAARRIEVEAERQPKLTAVPGGKAKPKRSMLGSIDIPMLTIVLLLLFFGLVMLFSASYPSGSVRRGDSFFFIRSQVQYAVIGLVGMLAATFFDYRLLKKFAWPLMVVALMLLVVVLFISDKNDAHRWIWLNSKRTAGFQPSEIAKLAVIMVFAKMFAANQSRIRTFKYGFFPFMLVMGVVALLLVMEPHLSCTILIIGVGVAMMMAGGTPMRWMIAAGLIVVGGAYFIITQYPELLPSYALERVATWRDPFGVPAEKGHQVIQSLIAVGSGGWTGRGIGNSVQKFFYLPEVYNDYIFAVVCEELGMLGALAVVLLFFVLLIRGIYIALRAKDKFGAMLVIGISVQIALQAFLHVAVNLNAIPSTGISLPFFSSGGTSLCMLLGEVGIVLSVSRHARMSILEKREEDADAKVPVVTEEQ
jgi:cell division protein FtsW